MPDNKKGTPNPSRKRKIKFRGNQHTTKITKKDAIISHPRDSGEGDNSDYCMLIDFPMVKSILEMLSFCPECHSSCTVVDELSSRMGFVHKLSVICCKCTWKHSFFTSQTIKDMTISTTPGSSNKKKSGRKKFQTNIRAVVAFREIGCGFNAMQKFAQCMNIYCLSNNAFFLLNADIHLAYKTAATESMDNVAKAITDGKCTTPVHSRVKMDGAWSKRGHSSLNGVVTATIGNKCIDVYALSKYCKGCQMWEKYKGTAEYQQWILEHQCHINHEGSSGAMEGAGAVEIFKRSVKKYNLIYNEYLGDGDTSSFKQVVDANVYKDFNITPQKLECIGHIQKRVGTRLRKLVISQKAAKKPISGKGKLTEKAINSMQNYYGMAIRNNIVNKYQMKKAIGAILWHCTNYTNESFRHRFCPASDSTWCKWQLDKKNGTNKYKANISIPIDIHNIIRPIFSDLSSNELLEKCLHGETQNSNEALNSLIWTRCPKSTFVNRSTFETGVYSAVLHFNEGEYGVKSVLDYFNISGKAFSDKLTKGAKLYNIRLKRKMSTPTKKRRKRLRTIKKGYLDKEKEDGKDQDYLAGGH